MNIIIDLLRNLKESFRELLFLRKNDRSRDTNTELILENGDIETFKGRLTFDNRFLSVPDLHRLYIKPLIHRKDGVKTVFMPEKTHGKLDITTIKNVALAQKYKILAKFNRAAYFDRTDFKMVEADEWMKKKKELYKSDEPFAEFTVSGSIDFSLFNNDLSPDFSADAFLTTQSTQLNVLQDIPNYKLLLIIGFFSLLGFIVGNGHMFIWMFVYNWVS